MIEENKRKKRQMVSNRRQELLTRIGKQAKSQATEFDNAHAEIIALEATLTDLRVAVNSGGNGARFEWEGGCGLLHYTQAGPADRMSGYHFYVAFRDGQNKPLIDTDREIQIAAVDVLDEVLGGIAKALLA